MSETAVREEPFPAPSKQATGLVNGVETEVSSMNFSDKIMVTISQGGRLAQWVGSRSPSTVIHKTDMLCSGPSTTSRTFISFGRHGSSWCKQHATISSLDCDNTSRRWKRGAGDYGAALCQSDC